jgi:transcriptional repressor NrdR
VKCPFCRDLENKVIDSRLSKDGDIIRRRRECLRCQRRFTTYERVEEMLPMIVKKDGRREVYDRLKVISGLKKACEKRPVSMEMIEQTGDRIERMLQERGEKEVSASVIGEAIMKALYDLDKVAYVRFASVYRSFEDVNEFMRELKDLIQTSREEPANKSSRARRKAAKAKP